MSQPRVPGARPASAEIDLRETEDELLGKAAGGDRAAFAALYLRHRGAAHRVAASCTESPSDAEDAVAEAVVRVFAALPRLADRQVPFRPYLLAAVRNAAMDGHRRASRIEYRDIGSHGETGPRGVAGEGAVAAAAADEGAFLGLERSLVDDALEALPMRWREVLWLTEVEQMSPIEISKRIGIKPNAVAALAYRSRRGFRSAYLQAHLRTAVSAHPECRGTAGRLARYVRGELDGKEHATVAAHLEVCRRCGDWADELREVSTTMRHGLFPLGGLLASVAGRFGPTAGDLSVVAPVGLETGSHRLVAGLVAAVAAVSAALSPNIGLATADRNQTAARSAPAVELAALRPTLLTTSEVAGPSPLTLTMSALSEATFDVDPAAPPAAAAARVPGAAGADTKDPDAGDRRQFGPLRRALWPGSPGDSQRDGGTRSSLTRGQRDEEQEGPAEGETSRADDGPVSGLLDAVDSLPLPLQVPLPEQVGEPPWPVSADHTSGKPLTRPSG